MTTTIDIDGNYQVVVSNHSNWCYNAGTAYEAVLFQMEDK